MCGTGIKGLFDSLDLFVELFHERSEFWKVLSCYLVDFKCLFVSTVLKIARGRLNFTKWDEAFLDLFAFYEFFQH